MTTLPPADNSGFIRDRDAYADGGLNASDMADGRKAVSPAAAATRMFILFAIPFFVMLIILIGAFAWKFSKGAATPAPAQVATASAPVPGKDAQIAQLQSEIIRLQSRLTDPAAAPALPGQAATPTPVYADPALIAQLSARLDRLEASQRTLARAAAAANAAATLQIKAHSSEPFLAELAAVEPGFDDPSLTAPLRAVAERGVASETQLAIDFPQAAARANLAAKAADGDGSLINRAQHALGGFVSVRRTDNPGGSGTEAILARAQGRLNQGDLSGCLANLDTLPPSARAAMKPWLDKAKARALVDRTTGRLTQISLQKLAQINNDLPVTAPAGGAL